jgi:ATP-dependent helicase HepA
VVSASPPTPFLPGQRWISRAEPELGLGTVVRVEGRGVQILFAGAGILRQYAIHTAPLVRAQFRAGQRVTGKGTSLLVEQVSEADGLLTYHAGHLALRETELDDAQSISRADERLVSARVDAAADFDFRLEALHRRAAMLGSPGYGLASARIDLIPHQLHVAEIVSARRPPRALLADEVGLGKTIEAGMILARLLATGRVSRVLVLVPASLRLQWFVELLRRFHLQFALYDEERCEAIEVGDETRNPFEDEQLVIADSGWLAGDPRRADQVIAADWDLVVVDEAHHLEWTPDQVSPAYRFVERLALRTPGLILLTATPQQLGRSGHFARLRLLDPARYRDLASFIAESDRYVALSRLAARLLDGETLEPDQREELAAQVAGDDELEALVRDETGDTQRLVDALIDRHGTGRVMFRNRRAQVGGFPRRIADLAVLDGRELDDAQRQRLLAEFHADAQAQPPAIDHDYANDPRLAWLTGLIDRLGSEKLLLICRTQAKVLALEDALRQRSGVGVARFHEGLSLVQRDRNAAWFAEADGARVLLCSEIGSEGRNFQFAHHLALWDLPIDPDLLEQRIGRVDRIGQRHDITIHACVFTGTAQHVLLRWYEQGLDAFAHSPADGRELLRRYGARLRRLAEQHASGAEDADAETDSLIGETREVHAQLSAEVEAGRDRLLELAASREARGDPLRTALLELDADAGADDFVLRLFEHFGVDNEELAPRSFVLDPEYLRTNAFPGLADGPRSATFDRATALAREELPLLRLDQPMVAGALDLLIESEQGNAAFLVDDALAPRTALLECVFVLECVAERRLDISRYLPPLPLRVVIDNQRRTRDDYAPSPMSLARARERDIDVARYRGVLGKLVPPLLERAGEVAAERTRHEVERALANVERELGAAIARLQALARVNPGVRAEEIAATVAERDALRAALPGAAPRLEALRFVCSVDLLGLR